MEGSNVRGPRFVKGEQQKKSSKGKNENSLKVVYISSPMKVKTSASRFRSLVQELTGKNSDISHYMEGDNSFQDGDFLDVDHEDNNPSLLLKHTKDNNNYCYRGSSLGTPENNTPTSSDSFFDPTDGAFAARVDDQFLGFFSNNAFPVSSRLDEQSSCYNINYYEL